MRCVIQRVTNASVTVEGEVVGTIERGFMVLVGVCADDGDQDVKYMSQFTLYGDARGSRRPSFIQAARPEEANARYEQLIAAWRAQGLRVETGRFRAEMQVALVNDGPVTILMDSAKTF